MFKLTVLAAAALAAGMAVAVAAPAPPATPTTPTATHNSPKTGSMNPMTGGSNFTRQDQFIGNFCKTQNAPDCLGWQQNHARWNNHDYRNFYWSHRGSRGFGAAAGIFGFAAGAALAASNAEGYDAHVAACQQRYRSYDVATDTYLGNDGRRHRCLL